MSDKEISLRSVLPQMSGTQKLLRLLHKLGLRDVYYLKDIHLRMVRLHAERWRRNNGHDV